MTTLRNNRKILFVVAGLPARGGGFSETVPALATALQQAGAEVTIATVAGQETLSEATLRAEAAGVRVLRFRPSFPKFLYFSWQMLSRLGAAVRAADAVFIHGHWTFPVWCAGIYALRNKKPLILRPAGSLNPIQLAHSKWRKKLAGVIDFALLRRADAIQVSSEAERDWTLRIRGMKPRADRVYIVRNGVDIPPVEKSLQPAHPGNSRLLLYIGRIHPMKGLDLLLDAFAAAQRDNKGTLRLAICGPDENGARALLEKQATEAGLADAVSFPEPRYGKAKWELIASADCVVLPSRSENFGMTAAEGLAGGKPVICTKGAPWAVLEPGLGTPRMGWWCDTSADGLHQAINALCACSGEELAEIGRHGREYALRELSWKATGETVLREISARTGQA